MAQYSEEVKRFLWNKLRAVPGRDPSLWKQDDYGQALKYTEYGHRDLSFGWEVDHIRPIALGGSDDLSNLRCLHWRRNVLLGQSVNPLLQSYIALKRP